MSLAPPRPLAPPSLWIFSRSTDLAVFALPAVLALALVAALSPSATPDDSPGWAWIGAVLLVDVAHVWSTAFVTYFHPQELRRHPERYALVPAAAWVLGVLLYGLGGPALFWRALAYLAVFHFVRQQYGWMALYRARAGERGRAGAVIDGAAIYAATLYPLIWWHSHLPRHFAWFLPGDFASGVTPNITRAAAALYATSLLAYLARALHAAARRQPIPWGKHLLLLATASTWYAGIILYDDDLAFTLTNVLSHGIPYAVLILSYARHTAPREPSPSTRWLSGKLPIAFTRFLLTLWLLAYMEELLWDRSVWHERPELFGDGLALGSVAAWLVPLLAVPQVAHYVLDGVFWRRGGNAGVRAWFYSQADSSRRATGLDSTRSRCA